jgi:intergrase/recombinase
MIHIFGVMGRPEIISGDNEIISRIVDDPEFQGIGWYVTTTHETNKNVIIERFIRTLKNYILKILADPNVKFNKFADLTTQLI